MKKNEMLKHFLKVSHSRIRENEKRLRRLTTSEAIKIMEDFIFNTPIIKVPRRTTMPRKNIINSLLRA